MTIVPVLLLLIASFLVLGGLVRFSENIIGPVTPVDRVFPTAGTEGTTGARDC
ncbi:MAG TPA: hypothetical protein VED85_08045 [Burkholderiaceae bacterium]|nr:hypothetical protein [Burkholderiaceae bacterium]